MPAFVQLQGPIARQHRLGQLVQRTSWAPAGIPAHSGGKRSTAWLSILLFLYRVHASFPVISFKVVYEKTMNSRGTDSFLMSPHCSTIYRREDMALTKMLKP